MKRIIFYKILLFLICTDLSFSQLPVVKVSPAEINLDLMTIGEIFVRVENISGFRAYSINLSYDSQKMRCLSITKGSFFSNWNTFFFTIIDSNSNTLMADEAILGLGYENGSGDLFKVQFLALEKGDINLNFLNFDLRDTLNNVIEVQIENGIIHILDPTLVKDIISGDIFNSIVAYPNPFNSSTRIRFIPDNNEESELAIYSITGEKLFSMMPKQPGNNTISFIWSGKDMNGNNLSSGIYFLVARSKNDLKTFKLILLK